MVSWFPRWRAPRSGLSNCSEMKNSENRWGEKPGRPLPVAFLLTRNLEDYLDLFGFFETIFRLRR